MRYDKHSEIKKPSAMAWQTRPRMPGVGLDCGWVMNSCDFLVRAAKYSPIDVRPQLFACHSTFCDALDVRAVVGWDLISHAPVAYLLRGSAKRSRQ